MHETDTQVVPFNRALQVLWPFLRPYKVQICGALVALIITSLTVLSAGWGVRILIDQGFTKGDSAQLDTALIGLLCAIMVLAAATYCRFFTVSWLAERVVADLRLSVYQHLLTFQPSFFEGNRAADISSRLTTDTTLIETVIGSTASTALRNGIMLIGGLVLLVLSSPKLSGLVAVVVPVVVGSILLFGRRVRLLSRASQDRTAEISVHTAESLGAISVLQAFVQEAADFARFRHRVEATFIQSVQRIRARALLTALVIFNVFGAVGLVLWVGGQDVLSGRMTAGTLSGFIFYAVLVAGTLGSLSEVIGDLQRAAGATDRLIDLLHTSPQITVPPNPQILSAVGALSFEHVRFRYPTRPDTWAIDDLTLRIEPGERVAIVGPSGSGKTTLFQLLLRFYDPECGTVSVGGIDLRHMDPALFRSRMALVPQDPLLFAATIADNIRLGRPDADLAHIVAAATAAAAHAFIEDLPDGYDTHLGERGIRLSGGQRQRIAIARALICCPDILLLDEATSALDTENEAAVQATFEASDPARLTLVIAHRLSTVRQAERILVMDQGRLVADGSHNSLMMQGGVYKRLAERQLRAS